MKNIGSVALVASMLLPQIGCSRGGDRWVIVSVRAIDHELPLCSRSGPRVDGTWQVTTADVEGAEKKLSEISMMPDGRQHRSVQHPEIFYRQYSGIISNGQKLIYLNASLDISERWRTQFMVMCDGGSSFWGAVYDPKSGTFADLRTNGSA